MLTDEQIKEMAKEFQHKAYGFCTHSEFKHTIDTFEPVGFARAIEAAVLKPIDNPEIRKMTLTKDIMMADIQRKLYRRWIIDCGKCTHKRFTGGDSIQFAIDEAYKEGWRVGVDDWLHCPECVAKYPKLHNFLDHRFNPPIKFTSPYPLDNPDESA